MYWWHRLDDEGFIQFTICVLEKFNRANTEDFTLVLIKGMNLTPVRRSRISSKRKLARIWEGLAKLHLSYVSIMREIETWENTLFDFEEKWTTWKKKKKTPIEHHKRKSI